MVLNIYPPRFHSRTITSDIVFAVEQELPHDSNMLTRAARCFQIAWWVLCKHIDNDTLEAGYSSQLTQSCSDRALGSSTVSEKQTN